MTDFGRLPLMHVLLGMALLSLFCLPLRVQAASSLLVSRENNPTVLGDQEIVVTPREIHIKLKERVLHEVLQQIRYMSGVHFSLPPAMRKIPVTTTIDGPDWPTVVRKLLRPFNTFEVWGQNGNQLLQVFLLKRGRTQILPAETAHSSENGYQNLENTNALEAPLAASVPFLPPPPPVVSTPLPPPPPPPL